MGPLILDIAGFELDSEDCEILAHPTVGGVLFFARNFHDKKQLIHLIQQIRKQARLNNKELLICVDQEGGRVQRFKEGFSLIPAAADYAQYAKNAVEQHNEVETAKQQALLLAHCGGWLMSAELLALDIDFSLAPVLDLGFQSKAIGNRAFSENVNDVVEYASAYISGMKEAGMATTGKHFPGHGGVIADSHIETPFDHRQIDDLDLKIFKMLIDQQKLDAILPAHVIYPAYDNKPAVASPYWLKQVLRTQLNFDGIVFSDDLNMHGADILGNYGERCQYALDAGCDMVLLCNNRAGVAQALDTIVISPELLKQSASKGMKMRHYVKYNDEQLHCSKLWQQRSELIKSIL